MSIGASPCRRKVADELIWMLRESIRYLLDSQISRSLSLIERQRLIEERHRFAPRHRKFHLLLLLANQEKLPKSRVAGLTQEFQQPYIFKLPVEIQLSVIRHLEFWDIRNLRQTCKRFYRLLNRATICRRFGGTWGFRAALDKYCRICLFSPVLEIAPKSTLFGHDLFRSTCWYCNPGTFFCKWCGFEIDDYDKIRDFHPACFRRYLLALWIYFLLGCVQVSLYVANLALAWIYYKDTHIVVGPVTVSIMPLS